MLLLTPTGVVLRLAGERDLLPLCMSVTLHVMLIMVPFPHDEAQGATNEEDCTEGNDDVDDVVVVVDGIIIFVVGGATFIEGTTVVPAGDGVRDERGPVKGEVL